MKRYGVEWKGGGCEWYGARGRYHLHVWPFGQIYQCKVIVQYAYSSERFYLGAIDDDSPAVGICLSASETRDKAMKLGLKWIEEYEATGPATPERLFQSCYENWKTLYQTRPDVIDHVFYTIGNGYDWLDGAIVNTGPYDHIEAADSDLEDKMDGIAADWEELRKKHPDLPELPWKKREHYKVGPHPDDHAPRSFYPASERYSNLTLIPEDVTNDWLEVCYEAALMLRDRSDVEAPNDEDRARQIGNKVLGERLVTRIENKFGRRLKHSVQSYQELVQAKGL